MNARLQRLINSYDPSLELADATTPPAAWYHDREIAALEVNAVFGRSWQLVARTDQLLAVGDYVTAEIGDEPIIVVRDSDRIQGFFNVCRHHAAQVATGEQGSVRALHCPYHGWTYNLDGTLRSAPQFDGAKSMTGDEFNLQPVRVETWRGWVFVCLDSEAPALAETLSDVDIRFEPETLDNWKVFVDNYLDGGYHVPYLHRELTGALDTSEYRIDIGARHCMQSCPTSSDAAAAGSVRTGTAWYLWLYPNLMINWYEGVMDVNLVLPAGPERCIVHFDYYFANQNDAFREQSIAVADRVQQEDMAICRSVQRGLRSRSYDTGRLSPVKEGGEWLFHRLLHGDLSGELRVPGSEGGSGRSVRRNLSG
jgi:choline monooxygenase